MSEASNIGPDRAFCLPYPHVPKPDGALGVIYRNARIKNKFPIIINFKIEVRDT